MLHYIIKQLREEIINICTNTFLAEYDRQNHGNYNSFLKCVIRFRWYLQLHTYITHFVFLPPSASTSGGLVVWCFFFCVCEVVRQSFIPEGFEFFVILLELHCCSFPLTLITEYGNTKWCSKDLLHYRYNSSYFHCRDVSQFILGNLYPLPILTLLFLV